VELMVDRPSDEWPRASDGSIAMRVDPLDLRELVLQALAEPID
jgi:catechol-2,3-dioxygenase